MCINSETSLIAFLLGTLFNYSVLKTTNNINFKIVAYIYQFILLVQLFEFFIWKDNECGEINKIATKGLIIVTILQPIIILLIILYNTEETNKDNKLFTNLLIILFIIYIFYSIIKKKIKVNNIDCIKIYDECNHIEYKWLDKFKYWDVFYGGSILLTSLLLIKDTQFIIYQFMFLLIISIINEINYKCGKGSMLCLYGAIGPIFNYILMKLSS
jgi:hypothetical protein